MAIATGHELTTRELSRKGVDGRGMGRSTALNDLKRRLGSELFQERIVGIWADLLEGSKRERLEALKIAVSLLPREDKLQHEIAQVIINKEITRPRAEPIPCTACGLVPHEGRNPSDTNTLQPADHADGSGGPMAKGVGGVHISTDTPHAKNPVEEIKTFNKSEGEKDSVPVPENPVEEK